MTVGRIIPLDLESSVDSRPREAEETTVLRFPAHQGALARKQGMYAVIAQGGLILKRGHELAPVLRVLVKKPKLAT